MSQRKYYSQYHHSVALSVENTYIDLFTEPRLDQFITGPRIPCIVVLHDRPKMTYSVRFDIEQ